MKRFPFAPAEQLAENLWVLDEVGSNIFLIKGEEKVLVIDTSYGLTDLKAAVRELFGDYPMMLVNTHAHYDHNSGNCQFDTAYVGRFDEPGSHHVYDEAGRQHLIAFMGDRLLECPFDEKAWNPGPAENIVPLSDGDVIDIGGLRFTVIETPGHTLGSIALFEPEKRWLFTGDTVLTWEVWGQLPNSTALRIYAQSLDKLASYEDKIDYVFPSHSMEKRPAGYGRYWLPPSILSIYAEGTRAIVEGKLQGRPYTEINPRFTEAEYVHFEVGGMAYDPKRI